ncbi:MAG: hypothetical protein OXF01_02980 [Gemmatimonadetes bacterium]|nr:hypothetical protein [Gemmatimonadota bacterium]
MERMNLEQLARLVDKRPTPEEQRVLDGDPKLRRELEALKEQSWSLRNLPALLPPPGGWHQLERKLSAAGLIHGQSRAAVWRKWLQVAAALVLFIGGTAAGWFTAEARGLQAGGGVSAATAASFAQPASLDEAVSLVKQKELEYWDALAKHQRLWQAQVGAQTGQNPATRLPYIEALSAAAHVAAEANPADPFINHFLVRAMAEQEKVLRQISRDNWN